MMRIAKANRGLLSMFAAVVASVVLTLTIFVGPALADDSSTISSTYNNISSLSFSNMSISFGSYFNYATSPSNTDATTLASTVGDFVREDSPWGGNVGLAADYMGYTKNGWLTSLVSGSSATYSYSSLDPYTLGGNTAEYSSFLGYARYGYLLNQLGLDEQFGNVLTTSIPRLISGLVLLISWAFASVVPAVFSGVLSILVAFNPFTLLTGAVSMVMSPVGGADVDNSFFANASTLVKTISGWYDAFYDLGLGLVIPITAAVFVMTFFMGQVSKRASSGKKLLMRILIIVFCVPVCGALYTATLNLAKGITTSGSAQADDMVASTLCDFKSWSETYGLGLPSEAGVTLVSEGVGGGSPTSGDIQGLAALCFDINTSSNAYRSASSDTSSGSVSWDEDSSDVAKSSPADGQILSMITSYMLSDTYTSSDFETYAKSELSSSITAHHGDVFSSLTGWKAFFDGVDGTSRGLVAALFDNANKDYKKCANPISLAGSGVLLGDGSDIARQMTDYGLSPILGSGLESTCSDSDGHDNANTSATERSYTYTYGSDSTMTGDGIDNGHGLTALGMYNYLNSSFSSTGFEVVEPSLTNLGTTITHMAVTVVGASLLQRMLNFSLLVLMLMAITVIGIGYALGVLFGVLGNSFSVLTSSMLTALGSRHAAAKFVGHVVLLIVELIGTILLYDLMSQLMFSILNTLSANLSEGLSSINGDNGILSVFNVVLSDLVGCAFLIFFTVFALRQRKSFVRAITEGVNNITDRFFLADAEGVPQGGASGMTSTSKGGGSGNLVADAAGAAVGGAVAGGVMGAMGSMGGAGAAGAAGAEGAAAGAGAAESGEVTAAGSDIDDASGASSPSGGVTDGSDADADAASTGAAASKAGGLDAAIGAAGPEVSPSEKLASTAGYDKQGGLYVPKKDLRTDGQQGGAASGSAGGTGKGAETKAGAKSAPVAASSVRPSTSGTSSVETGQGHGPKSVVSRVASSPTARRAATNSVVANAGAMAGSSQARRDDAMADNIGVAAPRSQASSGGSRVVSGDALGHGPIVSSKGRPSGDVWGRQDIRPKGGRPPRPPKAEK